MTSPDAAHRADTLRSIVEAEARRVLSDAELRPDPQRVAEGWERRFVTDAHRAEEVIALYESLGLEVCADPLRPDELGPGCDDCALVAVLRFRTIYTRKRRD
ncbi:MAG: hypothetical protein OER21_12080 [Gemmatimonadota bacterium]|nr:hypothetical protein [Gemmatimonadota bacterium]